MNSLRREKLFKDQLSNELESIEKWTRSAKTARQIREINIYVLNFILLLLLHSNPLVQQHEQ